MPRPSLVTQVLSVNAVLITATVLAVTLTTNARLEDLVAVPSQLLLAAAILSTILVNGFVLRRRFAPLEALIATMERVDLTRPGVRADVAGADSAEVERLQAAFNLMLERLEHERAHTARAVLRGQEEERARLARDLHDEANQSLTGLLLRLEAAAHHAPPGLARELDETKQLASQAMGELLALARELRPTALDDHGLTVALRGQIERFRTPSGVRASLELAEDADLDALGEDEQLVIYRIVQESLSNAARHAGAQNVTIEVTGEPGHPTVRVRDDGCGFVSGRDGGLGLDGMRERARLVGGRVEISSRPGEGTTVELRLGASR